MAIYDPADDNRLESQMDKQELVDCVITQFQMDIENMDTSAIEELLFKLDEKYLIAYLPEEI
jgi:hypothetical protein